MLPHIKPAAVLAADKPHGMRIKYAGGCRCLPCRVANARYEAERRIARRSGDWDGLVPAERAREHLFHLSSLGVGRRTVADVCGVPSGILSWIRSRRRTTIRKRTERRILSVTAAAVSDGTLVSAKSTWAKISWLREEGFTNSEISRRIGGRGRSLQFGAQRVTARTAMRIEKLWRRMQE